MTVFLASLAERAVSPEANPLFQGSLPIARESLSTALTSFDLVLVVGAELWRLYTYAAGPVLPSRLELLQITKDPRDAGSALVGDSLLSDARLALEGLHLLLRNITAPPSLNGTAHTPPPLAQSVPR